MPELMPALSVLSPWGAMVALVLIVKLINGRAAGGGKPQEPNGQVTERLCLARRSETDARLGAIEDKLDTAITLIKNGGRE